MRAVRLLEGTDLLLGEVDIERRDRIGKMMRLGGPNDGRRDDGILQYPSECYIRHRDAPGLGHHLDGFDDRSVAVDVEPATNRVDVKARRMFAPRPC